MTIATTSPAEAGIAVGDFYVCSWGYDQTNVDFYKVVGLTAKGVKIQPWTKKFTENLGSHDSVVPGEGPAQVADWSAVTPEMDYHDRQEVITYHDAPAMQKRLRADSAYIAMTTYSVAKKWDGEPEYQTGQGYGH